MTVTISISLDKLEQLFGKAMKEFPDQTEAFAFRLLGLVGKEKSMRKRK
ncbi:MAG: hypothetical protein Q4G22_11515 [Paracoccus sp. (in: a-proteobacteria)]|nr:hypothetical protein [Paracoccus sp. (in: a-proteobacteria)]MDO5632450.1 hypothetical protein [Paracoccus sp. (in: a-proteobacteria)]